MGVRYNIISTGSQGNAVVIEDAILVDCGVPFKGLQEVYKKLKIVLLTHIHTDHFSPTAIRTLARERPTLRFTCGEWLLDPLLVAGVARANIDLMRYGVTYAYFGFDILPVRLYHDAPNCGYKIHFADGRKAIYATDTNSLSGIEAKGYDLYMLEANHDEAELADRIAAKVAAGEFAYEIRVARTHLSKEKCEKFILENAGALSEIAYLHCHQD